MNATVLIDAPWDYSRPALRLERLLRRNAVLFQGVFAVLWSVRLADVAGPWELPALIGVAFALSVRHAFRSTAGLRARDEFRTAKGRAFLRPVTTATLWQVGASVVLPVAASMIGLEHWSIPLVALTITVFLVAFGRQLQLPSVRGIGAAATIAVVLLPFLTSDDALVGWVSAVMATSLAAAMVISARATV